MSDTNFSHPLTAEQTSARYQVQGWPGVAVRITGWTTENVYEGDILVCEDEDCDHGMSEMCWCEGDTETVEGEMLCVVMVGDDRVHEVDPDDLIVIDDLDYCAECGQIGCQHDGRDRE